MESMLNKAIERLEEVVEAETAALLSNNMTDLEEFNRRKSQSLLELTRLARTLSSGTPNPEVRLRLEELRAKLDKNHSTLEMHLKAVQEVSDIVSKAIRSADSDGTYSANHLHQSDLR